MKREFPYESRDVYEISGSLGLGFKRMRTPVVKEIGIARHYLAYAKDFKSAMKSSRSSKTFVMS